MTLAIVIAYFALLVIIGLLARLKVRNSADQYFIAGRGLGTFINSWAFLATLASGGTVLAGVGTGLSLGLPYILALSAGSPVGFAVASVLVARPLRNLGQYTVPDYFRSRFQSRSMAWAVPVIILLGSMAYLVSQLKGSAIVAEHILGWDYDVSVIITGLVFVIYVSIGGFLAVSWNDVFQGILMFCSVTAFALAVLFSINSFTNTFESTVTKFPDMGNTGDILPVSSYIGGFVTWAVAISVLAHVIMRVYSATNVRSAKISLNVSMIIFGLISAMQIVLIGVASKVPGVSADSGDEAFLLIAEHFLGPILLGVVAAAILAAIMSTTAGLLMVCNAAVANDIYARLLKPEASQKTVILVAGIATWVVGIIAILFSLNPPDFIIVLYTAAVGFMASAFFFPMVLGIWWRRCTDAGALAGLTGGAVVFALIFLFGDLPDSTEVLVSLPVSAALTVLVSLLSDHRSKAEQGAPESVSDH